MNQYQQHLQKEPALHIVSFYVFKCWFFNRDWDLSGGRSYFLSNCFALTFVHSTFGAVAGSLLKFTFTLIAFNPLMPWVSSRSRCSTVSPSSPSCCRNSIYSSYSCNSLCWEYTMATAPGCVSLSSL